MVQIYRSAFDYYRASLLPLLGFAALLEGMIWLLEPKREAMITLAPLIILTYMFHRHFLFGETIELRAQPGARPFKFGWFLLLSVALILVPLGFGILGTVSLLNNGVSKERIMAIMLILILPFYLIMLCLFGTALPALVERNPQYRLRAGIKASLRTLGYLLVAPLAVGAAVFAGLLALDSQLATVQAYQSPLGQLAINIIARTLGFLPTILTVAVLCHVYRQITPAPAD